MELDLLFRPLKINFTFLYSEPLATDNEISDLSIMPLVSFHVSKCLKKWSKSALKRYLFDISKSLISLYNKDILSHLDSFVFGCANSGFVLTPNFLRMSFTEPGSSYTISPFSSILLDFDYFFDFSTEKTNLFSAP